MNIIIHEAEKTMRQWIKTAITIAKNYINEVSKKYEFAEASSLARMQKAITAPTAILTW
jgi:hypothetical protein